MVRSASLSFGSPRKFVVINRASIKLIRALQPVLSLLTGNPITRTLLPSSRPARGRCPGVHAARAAWLCQRAVIRCRAGRTDRRPGATRRTARLDTRTGGDRLGPRGRVTFPGQAETATRLFPDARGALVRSLRALPALGRPVGDRPAHPRQHRLTMRITAARRATLARRRLTSHRSMLCG